VAAKLAKSPRSDEALTPENALLGFLALEPAHGYELHRRLTQELGALWHASLGHVYNVLKRMEAQRLIAGKLTRASNYPPQRTFTLTAAGWSTLQAWLRKPCTSSARAIRLEFLARLYFAQRLDHARAGDMLNEQRAAVVEATEQLAHMSADATAAPDFARLAVALRLAQSRAMLTWIDEQLIPAAQAAPAKNRRSARAR
jgi:PadR family transcriptional regulator, regulatory protein AphA